MKILVINCGSSSLKYQLMDMSDLSVLCKGVIERIGMTINGGEKNVSVKVNGQKFEYDKELPTHTDAFNEVKYILCESEHKVIDSMKEIDAVGHRIVQGGDIYTHSVLVDETVVENLRKLSPLAPLHNNPEANVIEFCLEQYPDLPNVTVYDTAFHFNMPEVAKTYALPKDVCDKLHIRKYGAHGTSYRYISKKVAEMTNGEARKVVVCHIGSGASLCAIEDGKCMDTTMGLTPLDGVMMGTRCGSIDPATVCYLQREGGYSYQEVDDMMNKQSGLLAISGISNDARDIRTRASEGDERCLLAFDMFAYKAMQQAGSMIASMAGVDTITFTAGIGENDWSIRKAFCDCFEWLGVRIDNNKNREAVGNGPQVISAAGSAVTVMVIPTDEEYMIAHDVERLTANN